MILDLILISLLLTAAGILRLGYRRAPAWAGLSAGVLATIAVAGLLLAAIAGSGSMEPVPTGGPTSLSANPALATGPATKSSNPAPRGLFAVTVSALVEAGHALWQVTGLPGPPATPAPRETIIHFDDDGLIINIMDTPDCHAFFFAPPDSDIPAKCQDGGDTAQREGFYWFGVCLRQQTPGMTPWTQRRGKRNLNFDQVLRLLEPNLNGVPKGTFYRHPKIFPYNQPFAETGGFGFSRDQLIPIVAAMGLCGGLSGRYDQRIHDLWNALPEDIVSKHTYTGHWEDPLGLSKLIRNGAVGRSCQQIKNISCNASCPAPPSISCAVPRTPVDACPPAVPFVQACQAAAQPPQCALAGLIPGLPEPPECRAFDQAQRDCQRIAAQIDGPAAAAHSACEASARQIVSAAAQTCSTIQQQTQATFAGTCQVAEKVASEQCQQFKSSTFNSCQLGISALGSYYTGDFIYPQTVNLFRRALRQNAFIPTPADFIPDPVFQGGPFGEDGLKADVLIRADKGYLDRDSTGDDLDLLVELLFSIVRSPTPSSHDAVVAYQGLRPQSYGSFMDTYLLRCGTNMYDPLVAGPEIDSGIQFAGWVADRSVGDGAIRWYNRADRGANEALATLYAPLIDFYLRDARPIAKATGGVCPTQAASGVRPPALPPRAPPGQCDPGYMGLPPNCHPRPGPGGGAAF